MWNSLSGENFADSWVDIKGNRYTMARNHGVQGDNQALKHGVETHSKAGNWGRNNIFYINILSLNANGYGFHIDITDANHGNTVCANNQVSGAGLGSANIALTGAARVQPKDDNTIGAILTLAHSLTVSQNIWLPLISTFPCD